VGNLLRTEWFKLSKDRSFRLLAGILVMFSLSYPLMLEDQASLLDWVLHDNGVASLFDSNTYFVKLAPCILAGFFISSEYTMGTLKSITASGYSRVRIYLAKLMVFSVGAVVLSLISPIVMLSVISMKVGVSVFPEWGYLAQIIGLLALYSASFAAIMAAFAIGSANSGITIGFLLLFFMFFDSVIQALSIKFPILATIYDYSVFMRLKELSYIDKGMSGSEWAVYLLIPMATFLVFVWLGAWNFRKRDI
jgi:ABC-2 type transport system permease protein